MIYVAGISIAVLIEFLLISKKNKSASDKLLTLWMFVILTHLFLFYLYSTGRLYEFPFLMGFEQPFPLLHGVLLFLYVSSLTNQLPARRWLLALHFLPAGIVYLYLLATFFPLTEEQKIGVYLAGGAGFDLYGIILMYAITLSGIVYVTWSVILLLRHEKRIREQFSDLEKINLRWLRVLTYGLGGIWILVISQLGDDVIYMGVVGFVFLMGFFGIRQTDIFLQSRFISAETGQKEKYQRSGLSEQTSNELHQTLVRLMTQEFLYKKSDLSIDDLAEKAGAHPNHLSQVINQREQKNFYDFVNFYRIEEFKRLIAAGKNRQFTLLSLAYDCGFSSKTSFNRVFRKSTGKTPSEFVSEMEKAGTSPT